MTQEGAETKEMVKQEQVTFAGLVNQGATCYMNAYLQMLFMIPEFRAILFSLKYDKEEHGDEEDFIPLQLQLLFTKLQMKQNSYVDTLNLIKSFKWDRSEMFVQHDVQEFARILFEAMEISFQNSEGFEKLNNLFQGESLNYVRCKECPYESMRIEKWLDLQMTIENKFENISNDRIEQALQTYLKPELLIEGNQYNCEECGKKVDAEKGVRFFKLPEVMIFNLNRFTIEYTNFTRIKINNFVSFPLVLNMNNYINGYDNIPNKFNLNQNEAEKAEQEDKQDHVYGEPSPIAGSKDKKYRNIKSTSCTRQFLKEARENKKKIAEKATKGDITVKVEISDNFDHSQTLNSAPVIFEPTLSIGKVKASHAQLSEEKDDTNIPPPPPSELLVAIKEERHRQETYQPPKVETVLVAETGSQISAAEGYTSRLSKMDKLLKERINECFAVNPKDLVDEYLKDGDLVYELSAIVIHSGSAFGGHYYSFIRDTASDTWHRFDDRRVTPISLEDVAKEAFGLKTHGSSAYMLIYKKYNPKGPPTVELPTEYLEICKKELEEESKRIQSEKEKVYSHMIKDNSFKINIYRDGKSNLIETTTSTTLNEFMKIVQERMELTDTNLYNIRIRRYDHSKDIMLDTFDGMGNRTLLDLGIVPGSKYALETKLDSESFEDYDPNIKKYSCFIWKDTIVSSDHIEADFSITINTKKTVKDLMEIIRDNLKGIIPNDQDIFVFKRRLVQNNLKEAVLLNAEETMEHSLEELQLYPNSMILIEVGNRVPLRSEFLRTEESKWKRLLEEECYSCIVQYNEPDIHKDSVLPRFDRLMKVDTRSTLFELKQAFSEELDIELDKFVIKRGGRSGIELKDLEKTLVKSGFSLSTAIIFLEFGTPTLPGQIKLRVMRTEFQGEITLSHNITPVAEVAVEATDTPSVIIQKAIQICKDESELDLSGRYFRLRDKKSRSLTRLFREDGIKKQGVFDGKQIVMEEIDPQIQDPQIGGGEYLTYVIILDPMRLEFQHVMELSISKTDSLRSFSTKIIELFPEGTVLEDIEIARTVDVWRLDPFLCIGLSYRNGGDKSATLTGSPFYIGNDGVGLIVKDSRLKFRDLTPEEKTLMDTSSKYRLSVYETSFDFRTLKMGSVKRRQEKGIKIYARRADKDREEKKLEEDRLRKQLESQSSNEEKKTPEPIKEEKPEFEFEETDLEPLF